MLLRCAVAALLATSACVTVDDVDEHGVPLDIPAAAVDHAPTIDVADDAEPEPPVTWTDHRPRPETDRLSTLEDGAIKVTIEQILANDLEPDGGRLVLTGLGYQAGGTVEQVENYLVFTPDPDFTGLAFYDYVVSDGRLPATGRVEITVLAVNDAPVAYPDRITVVTGTETVFHLAIDDIDGDALSVEILAAPAHGALSGVDDKYTYAPAAGFTGADQLTYRVSDGAAWSAPTTVDLVVMAN
jgi:hypothetical protein